MFKGLGMLVGGIFVGAVGIEILHKKYPGASDKAYKKIDEIASHAKEAFQAGYGKATQPEKAAHRSA